MVEAAEVQNLHETRIGKDIKCHNLNLKIGILRITVTGIPDDRFQRAEANNKTFVFLVTDIWEVPLNQRRSRRRRSRRRR